MCIFVLFLCWLRSLWFCVVEVSFVGFSFLNTKPTDWLGRMSPVWPISCGMGRKTLLSLRYDNNSIVC